MYKDGSSLLLLLLSLLLLLFGGEKGEAGKERVKGVVGGGVKQVKGGRGSRGKGVIST